MVLLPSTSTNVQLGATASGANSPLLHSTYLNASTFFLEVNGAKTGVTTSDGLFRVVNTASGTVSVYAENTSGIGVWGNSTGGTGVYGQTTDANGVYGVATTSGMGVRASSDTYYGMYASSQTGFAIGGQVSPTSNNDVKTIVNLIRDYGGVGSAANGIGGSIDYNLDRVGGTSLSNQLISKFTDVSAITSQFIITGVNSSVTQSIVTMDGDGTSTFLGISSPTNTVRSINTTGTAVKGESTTW
jgi:hypothetical protein